ncbi:hypothetical protein BSZ32_01125 [Rubritalea profundi]|uniref:Uncharacterized protein n=1 Tax=Rubritalea profundi TaxID=1658618 RepID=A0A2S7TWV8_9BACT|nr:hypothetical protein BSZ32_01125 [Rubritalea profundi]
MEGKFAFDVFFLPNLTARGIWIYQNWVRLYSRFDEDFDARVNKALELIWKKHINKIGGKK